MNTTSRLQNLCVMILLGLALLAAPAGAGVDHSPLKLRLKQPPRAAKAWESFQDVFVVLAGADVKVTDIAFTGKGWQARQFAGPGDIFLTRGQILEIPFAATPTDPSQPLGISYKVEGYSFHATVNIGADKLADLTAPARLVPDKGSKVVARDQRWPERTYAEIAESQKNWGEKQLSDDPNKTPGDKARTITVRGTNGYWRYENRGTPAARPTWEPSSQIAVYIMDEDTGFDDVLGFAYANADGTFEISFTWDPCYLCEDNPDIYVETLALDANVDVQTTWLEWTYGWDSWVEDDFTGTELNFGGSMPDKNVPAAHLFQIYHRAANIFEDQGYAMERIDIQWPEDDPPSYYNPVFNEIHIDKGSEWNEGTYLHEYGHFWDDLYSLSGWPDYDNGICNVGGEPSHCQWCQENDSPTVVSEAFATYVAYLLGDELNNFLPKPDVFRYTENLGECYDNLGQPCPCDPLMTEGFQTAFWVDVADDLNENDQRVDPLHSDVLTLSGWTLMSIADMQAPQSAAAYYAELVARYPQYKEELWETAMNNGQDYDDFPPPRISDLTSATHTVNMPSPDQTVELTWSTPQDDASGVSGYSYVITQFPGTPPASSSPTIGDVNFLNTPPIRAGTWYINIATFDRAGNKSQNFATFGPVVIREPYPADLRPQGSSSWEQPLVVYQSWYSGGPMNLSPNLLGGHALNTYFAMSFYNNGESGFSEVTNMDTSLDGVIIDTLPMPGMSDFSYTARVNYAQRPIDGGRHTIGMVLDSGETLPETDETNNTFGAQYTWSPPALTTGTRITGTAPPDPFGGIAEFGGWYYNAKGYTFDNSANWEAVSCTANNTNYDYDLRLHQPRTSNTTGFGEYEAYSRRPAGALDVVLINRHMLAAQTWNVGVIGDPVQNPASFPSFTLDRVANQTILPLGSHAWSWASSERLSLKEFRLFTLDSNDLTLTLTTNAPQKKVHMGWFGPAFSRGPLDEATQTVTTDATGTAVMRMDNLGLNMLGYHCLAIYRDPSDGTTTMNLELTIAQTPPDLIPVVPEVWIAPLVPNHLQMAAGVMPDTLFGNTFLTGGTYLNQAVTNIGGLDAFGVRSQVYLDGKPFTPEVDWDRVNELQVATNIGTQFHSLRGGRHTLSLHVDHGDSVTEGDETSNIYGAQWVWSPLNLTFGNTTFRPLAVDHRGGFEDITAIEPVSDNCDGLRLPAPTTEQPGNWQLVAAIAPDSTFLNLQLHEIAGGVKDGFSITTRLHNSNWLPGGTSYILINNRRTPKRAFDVGIVGGVGTGGYYAEAVNSTDLGSNPTGSQEARKMGPMEIAHIYEMELEPGAYTVQVANYEKSLNWGLAVHCDSTIYNPIYQRRSAATIGAAWTNPPGVDEQVTFTADFTAKYCIVVFRPDSRDIQDGGSYVLSILHGLSGVGDPPRIERSALTGIYPNPFNPQTTIAFDLVKSGRTRVDVYDVRGHRIKSLWQGTMEAGSHRLPWNGRDDRGANVASGVYFVRLVGDGFSDTRRAVLVE